MFSISVRDNTADPVGPLWRYFTCPGPRCTWS